MIFVFQLNHVYWTRDLVIKNDAKLTKQQEDKKEEILSSGTYLDQGFTRPKVIMTNNQEASWMSLYHN